MSKVKMSPAAGIRDGGDSLNRARVDRWLAHGSSKPVLLCGIMLLTASLVFAFICPPLMWVSSIIALAMISAFLVCSLTRVFKRAIKGGNVKHQIGLALLSGLKSPALKWGLVFGIVLGGLISANIWSMSLLAVIGAGIAIAAGIFIMRKIATKFHSVVKASFDKKCAKLQEPLSPSSFSYKKGRELKTVDSVNYAEGKSPAFAKFLKKFINSSRELDKKESQGDLEYARTLLMFLANDPKNRARNAAGTDLFTATEFTGRNFLQKDLPGFLKDFGCSKYSRADIDVLCNFLFGDQGVSREIREEMCRNLVSVTEKLREAFRVGASDDPAASVDAISRMLGKDGYDIKVATGFSNVMQSVIALNEEVQERYSDDKATSEMLKRASDNMQAIRDKIIKVHDDMVQNQSAEAKVPCILDSAFVDALRQGTGIDHP